MYIIQLVYLYIKVYKTALWFDEVPMVRLVWCSTIQLSTLPHWYQPIETISMYVKITCTYIHIDLVKYYAFFQRLLDEENYVGYTTQTSIAMQWYWRRGDVFVVATECYMFLRDRYCIAWGRFCISIICLRATNGFLFCHESSLYAFSMELYLLQLYFDTNANKQRKRNVIFHVRTMSFTHYVYMYLHKVDVFVHYVYLQLWSYRLADRPHVYTSFLIDYNVVIAYGFFVLIRLSWTMHIYTL